MQVDFLREITQHSEDQEGKQHEPPMSPESFKRENNNAIIKREASTGVLELISFDGPADRRAISQTIEQKVGKDALIGLRKELRRKTNDIHLLKHTLEERNKDMADLHATLEMPEYKDEKYWLEVKRRCLAFCKVLGEMLEHSVMEEGWEDLEERAKAACTELEELGEEGAQENGTEKEVRARVIVWKSLEEA